MNSFESALIVDAKHVLTLEDIEQSPEAITVVAERAAAAQFLAHGLRRRVVVADCSLPDERRVAEEFASSSGFRVRHVPGRSLADRYTVLAAEVSDVLLFDPDVKVVALLGQAAMLTGFIDLSHQSGRSVLILSAEISRKMTGADGVVGLPASSNAALPTILSAIREASAAAHGIDSSAPVELSALGATLKKQYPSFSPRHYGYAKLKDLLLVHSGKGYFLQRTTVNLADTSKPKTARQQVPSFTENGNPRGAKKIRPSAKSPKEQEEKPPTPMDELLTSAKKAIDPARDSMQHRFSKLLELMESDVVLKARAAGGGIPLQSLGSTFRAISPDFNPQAKRLKQIAQEALDSKSGNWTLAARRGMPEDIRLFIGAVAPEFESQTLVGPK